jgi:hypothetical protein
METAAWIPRDKLDSVWRAGEMTLTGRINSDSGFTILLTDASDPERMVREALEVFMALASHVGDLLNRGARAEIDFALFTGPDTSTSLVLEPAILRVIEQGGVGVVVSAYPVEAHEDD